MAIRTRRTSAKRPFVTILVAMESAPTQIPVPVKLDGRDKNAIPVYQNLAVGRDSVLNRLNAIVQRATREPIVIFLFAIPSAKTERVQTLTFAHVTRVFPENFATNASVRLGVGTETVVWEMTVFASHSGKAPCATCQTVRAAAPPMASVSVQTCADATLVGWAKIVHSA